MSKFTLIAIEGRYQRLATKIDTLIEKENQRLPPHIQLGNTMGSHHLFDMDIVKGKYIGFIFAIEQSSL